MKDKKLRELLKQYKILLDDLFSFLIADLEITDQGDLGWYIDRYDYLKKRGKNAKISNSRNTYQCGVVDLYDSNI